MKKKIYYIVIKAAFQAIAKLRLAAIAANFVAAIFEPRLKITGHGTLAHVFY